MFVYFFPMLFVNLFTNNPLVETKELTFNFSLQKEPILKISESDLKKVEIATCGAHLCLETSFMVKQIELL